MSGAWFMWQVKLSDATDLRGEVWCDFLPSYQSRLEEWSKTWNGDSSLQLDDGYWVAALANGSAVMQVSPSGTLRPVRRVELTAVLPGGPQPSAAADAA